MHRFYSSHFVQASKAKKERRQKKDAIWPPTRNMYRELFTFKLKFAIFSAIFSLQSKTKRSLAPWNIMMKINSLLKKVKSYNLEIIFLSRLQYRTMKEKFSDYSWLWNQVRPTQWKCRTEINCRTTVYGIRTDCFACVDDIGRYRSEPDVKSAVRQYFFWRFL